MTARTILHRTLPGEYVAILVAVQSAFIAIAWGCYSTDVLAQFGVATAAVWAVARTVGVGSRLLLAPVVTLLMLGITLSIRGAGTAALPGWLSSGPFSVTILTLILAAILALDILQVAEARGQQLADFVRRNGLSILGYGVAGIVVVYAIVVPVVQELVVLRFPPADPTLAMDRLTLSQNMLFKFVESFTGIWFFVVGAVVGSFLNVVVYRVPRHISVVAKRSHCPSCQAPILSSDNLPLVGWLRLNGRCRNCQMAIAGRYPLVEFSIGLLFLLLFFVELISGGTNLPVRNPNTYAGVQWILFYTKWDLVGLYVYHCFLVCTVFSWAMIRRDGKTIPLRASATTLAIAIAAPLLLPHLLPWPFNSDGTHAVTYTVREAAITSLLGLLAACLVMTLPVLSRTLWGSPSQRPPQFDRPSWLLIGAGLGWQSVISVLTLLILWTFACSLVASPDEAMERDSRDADGEKHQLSLAANLRQLALPCVVLLHLCFWRRIAMLFAAA